MKVSAQGTGNGLAPHALLIVTSNGARLTRCLVPEISAGYDISYVDGQDADTDAYFVGLTWKDMFQADDKIGIALGQPQTADTDTVTPFAWEAYYSYKVNDSVTVSPGIFGATDRTGTAGVDLTGAIIETTFKF